MKISKELGLCKRMIEMCIADPVERRRFFADPSAHFLKKDMGWGETEIPIHMRKWMEEAVSAVLLGKSVGENNPFINAYVEGVKEVHKTMAEKNSRDKFADNNYLHWYERQKRRYFFQSRKSRMMEGYFLVPIMFELTSGCSVGCPFCCLSAKRLDKVLSYQKNAQFWKDILRTSREILGDIAGAGALYFATEPFDNPEYECFLSDYHKMFGSYPQTTTAAADRDPERIRKFLAQIGQDALRHEAAVRFSVTTLEQMKKIHHLFSPQELIYIEILCNNPESSFEYCYAGRSREWKKKPPDKNFTDDFSCVCVNGFVVNICERTIRIISPCIPDETNPYGYLEFGRIEFTDAEEYGQKMKKVIEENMAERFSKTVSYKSEPKVKWEYGKNRLKVKGDGISRALSMTEKECSALLHMIEQKKTFEEAVHLLKMNKWEENSFLEKMNLFFESGYITACY